MIKWASIFLLSAASAFGQTYGFVQYGRTNFNHTPTNFFKSNFVAGANITITYDAVGKPTFATSGSSSIIVQTNGVDVATNSVVNFIAGSNISLLATNNTGDGKVDIQVVSTGAGDSDAIHDNVAGEIAAVADKASPASGDHILIEDSADSDNKKDVTLGSLESLLEGLMDLQDLQGAVTDSQVPNTITVDLATVATTANAGDSATAFFSAGEIEDARIAATLTRDTEWDTEGEVQTAWGGVNVLLETEIDASSELKALMDDETGAGPLVFAHGASLGSVDVQTNLIAADIILTNNVKYLTSELTVQSAVTNYTADFVFAWRSKLLTNNLHISAVANVPTDGGKTWMATLRNFSGATQVVSLDPSIPRVGTNHVAVANGNKAIINLVTDGSGGSNITNLIGSITLADSP